MGLDWEAFAQELLVEVLASLLTHEHTPTLVVLGGATGSIHHLKHIHNRIVKVAVFQPS